MDLDGYRQSKARQSGSPRSTKDFSAARAALFDALSGAPTASQHRLFGFPAHPNRFSLLAQSGSSRTRCTTAFEDTTVADSNNTLSEATPKAESRGKAAKFFLIAPNSYLSLRLQLSVKCHSACEAEGHLAALQGH